MSYSLLAHLYPRIKGSQEDIATFSLGYILEQSSVLNESFTKLVFEKLCLNADGKLSYHCQDSDDEFGRPDIAAYLDGKLKVLCEAKFYAGLTANQPAAYLRRLKKENGSGLLFICPRSRIISLWDKLQKEASDSGFAGSAVSEKTFDYDGVRMSIISWSEVLSELMRVASDMAPEYLGDLKQLQGFCEQVESESFVPFRPEDFGPQVARDIDRYYQVIDEAYKVLVARKDIDVVTKGLRAAPSWQGYSQYLKINGHGVSINFNRKAWGNAASTDTPFWCTISNEKWKPNDSIKKYYASLDAAKTDDSSGVTYIALIPKPYVTLEELAVDLADQVITTLKDIEALENSRG